MQAPHEPAIRAAVRADRAAVRRILDDTLAQTWWPQLDPAARQRFDAAGRIEPYLDECLAELRVAVAAGEVAGFVHWRADFIEALHVPPGLQRSGIGTRLLAHAEAAMRRAGHRVARLETDTFNRRSRRFYGCNGYAEVAQYPDNEWHSGFTTVLMTRTLD